MDHAQFPWRPLGELLVEEGLLTGAELDHALTEQRRTSRLLGQILVAQGTMTALELARALARQHGVEVRPAGDSEPETSPATSTRLPRTHARGAPSARSSS